MVSWCIASLTTHELINVTDKQLTARVKSEREKKPGKHAAMQQKKEKNVSARRGVQSQMTEMKLHRSHLEIILLLIANLTHGEFEVREKQQRTEQRQRRRREEKKWQHDGEMRSVKSGI